MNIKFLGFKKMNSNINTLKNKIGPSSFRKSIIKSMLRVEADSMRRTPVDTGNLRSSAAGNATITSSSSNGASGIVYYTANYAIYVHERTELRHNVGEAKFLQNAVAKEQQTFSKNIKVSIYSDVFKDNMV